MHISDTINSILAVCVCVCVCVIRNCSAYFWMSYLIASIKTNSLNVSLQENKRALSSPSVVSLTIKFLPVFSSQLKLWNVIKLNGILHWFVRAKTNNTPVWHFASEGTAVHSYYRAHTSTWGWSCDFNQFNQIEDFVVLDKLFAVQ